MRGRSREEKIRVILALVMLVTSSISIAIMLINSVNNAQFLKENAKILIALICICLLSIVILYTGGKKL